MKFKHILKHILYLFREFRVIGMLNFLGLILAFMAFYGFWGRLRELVSWDMCHDRWHCMYRIEMRGNILGEDTVHIANLPACIVPELRRMEGIDGVGIQRWWNTDITFQRGDSIASWPYSRGYGAMLSFWRDAKMFREGREKTVVGGDTLSNVFIPRSFSQWFFQTDDARGRVLRWQINGKEERHFVEGVYDDFPSNCSVENAIYNVADGEDISNASNYSYHIYVRVVNPDDVSKVCSRIREAFFKTCYYSPTVDKERVEVMLRPISEAYYSGIDKTRDKGSYVFIIIIFLAAQLPLALAYINFMNFQMAVAPYVIKTQNTHRIFGATRRRAIISQIVENIVIALMAYIVAIFLVGVLDRIFHLGLPPLSNLSVAGYTLLAAMVITLASSAYPARYTSSVSLDIAMKGVPAISVAVKRMRIVKLVFQMSMSFVIVGFVLSMAAFYLYIRYGDCGYASDSVVIGRINSIDAVKEKNAIRNEIEEIPGVDDVSLSAFPLGDQDFYMKLSVPTENAKQNMLLTVLPVDRYYLSTLGIRLFEGRNFLPEDAMKVVINKAAQEKYPWLTVGESIDVDGTYEIVGVSENVRLGSLRVDSEHTAMAFLLADSLSSPGGEILSNSILNIRISDNVRNERELLKRVREVYSRHSSGERIDFRKSGSNLSSLYDNEYRFFVEVSILGMIYIVITLIGILSQAMFEIQYRRREIFIRRVFGASPIQILRLRMIWCMKLLAVSFVISLPIVWFLTSFVLKGYYGHPGFLWVVYPLSFLLISAITLATVVLSGLYALRGSVIKQ